MKKFLFFTFIFAFSASLSAQKLPSVKVSDVKVDGIEAISKGKPSADTQIKKALLKDGDLQKSTIDYLTSNPETAASLMNLVKTNKGSNMEIMKSILGDKKLATVAIDYISKNPVLLQKAMTLVGM